MPQTSTSSETRWKGFEDLYKPDVIPTDADCPSKIATNPSNSRESPFKCTSNRVRDFVVCSECEKPRLLFSENTLIQEQCDEVERIKDEIDFSCGAYFFPEEHPMFKKIIVKPGLACRQQISLLYYSSVERRLLNDEAILHICFNCARLDVLEEPEMKEQHSSWAFRCETCKALGFQSSRKRKQGGFRQRGQRCRGRARAQVSGRGR